MKNTISFLVLLSLLTFIHCGKTIIKINNPSRVIEASEPADYHKRYINNFDGFQEYSKPVTPNKPQVFRSTWFTSKAEKEKHTTPVCANNVDAVILYPDWLDTIIHGLLGGITSSRCVLIYCTK
jgi:hypothetical protein